MQLTPEVTRFRSTLQEALYVIASSDPTVNDDRNKRFIIGSRWLNTVTNDEFVCINNVPTAAIWKNTTTAGSGSGLATHITTVDPTANDDTGDGYVVGQPWLNTTNGKYFIAKSVNLTAAVWIDTTASSGGGTAASVSAVPASNNSGTNVQTQLDNINSAIANVFFMGRLLTLVYVTGLMTYTVSTVPTKKPTMVAWRVSGTAPMTLTTVAARKPTFVTSYTTTPL